jgi:hypothetical protein
VPRPTAVARCDEIVEAGGDLCLSSVAPATPFRERASGSVDRPSGDGILRGRQKVLADAQEDAIAFAQGGRMSRLAVVAIAFAMLELPTRASGLVIPLRPPLTRPT